MQTEINQFDTQQLDLLSSNTSSKHFMDVTNLPLKLTDKARRLATTNATADCTGTILIQGGPTQIIEFEDRSQMVDEWYEKKLVFKSFIAWMQACCK